MQNVTNLYDRFERSASIHSSACALEVDNYKLTYGELLAKVESTAIGILDASGRSAPRRIGLLAARSLETYVGYLAIQRLGCTAVPLNPAFPNARNITISEAAQLDLVLSEVESTIGFSMPQVNLRSVVEEPARRTPVSAKFVGLEDLAYILFTSGSTGTPKGVPVNHANVSANLDYVINRYKLGPGARMSQMFDTTFDVSVFDMFAAWGSGATLVVPTRNDVLAPVRFVASREITHWCSVPSVISFARRLRALRQGAMPSLKLSLFVGEPLTVQQAQAWQAAAPNSILENFYGPTELTITCAEYPLPKDQKEWTLTSNGTVPIGKIYPHMEHLIIDGNGKIANEGELCVRGPQRFPGYLNGADNFGRFYSFDVGVATPYDGRAPLTSYHWYRTGDRVIGVDGILVHLGRLDEQIKVKGYRVELGEIEAVIREYEGVIDAVVLAVPTADVEFDLEACYTGSLTDVGAVLDHLRLKLPSYMVPRRIMHLSELPLNGNGKIDRRAISQIMSSDVG